MENGLLFALGSIEVSGSSQPSPPELVVNGSFTDGVVGWSNNGGSVAAVDGSGVFTFGEQWGGVNQNITLDPEKLYEFKFNVVANTKATATVVMLRAISGSINTIWVIPAGGGVNSYLAISNPTEALSRIRVEEQGANLTGSIRITGFSLKEVS